MNLQELNDYFFLGGPGNQLLLRYGCDLSLRGLFDPYSNEYGYVQPFDRIRILIAVRKHGISIFSLLEAYEELVERMRGNRTDIIDAAGAGVKDIAKYAKLALAHPQFNDEQGMCRSIAAEAEKLIPIMTNF